MFSPLHGYLEREFMGMYQVNFATPAGIAVTLDSTNTAPLSGSIYGATYGDVVAASTNTSATTVGFTTRELGWLLQPVTASGPSLLNIQCSISAGLVRTVTTDDITRLLFQGKIVQRNLTLASFLVC
jgi:hypothetical protein